MRRRQEDEAMAAATLQKEKDAATDDGLKAMNADNVNVAVDTTMPPMPLPLVVSPPLVPNLTSLLTGHVGQEVGMQADDNGAATVMVGDTQAAEHGDDNVKSPPKKIKKLSQQKRINW